MLYDSLVKAQLEAEEKSVITGVDKIGAFCRPIRELDKIAVFSILGSDRVDITTNEQLLREGAIARAGNYEYARSLVEEVLAGACDQLTEFIIRQEKFTYIKELYSADNVIAEEAAQGCSETQPLNPLNGIALGIIEPTKWPPN